MRAQLAISAFTETVLANLEYLEENIEVLDQRSNAGFIKKTRKIEKYLAVLGSKKKEDTGMYLLRVPFLFPDVSNYS